MSQRYIFHLSIPVAALEPAKRFYVTVLGAHVGRENSEWLDILLWGHQITLQLQPEEVMPIDRQGKRHFGVVLPWVEWEREVAALRHTRVEFLSEPKIHLKDTADEQAKFYLADPSNNVIEVKAYRNVAHTLQLQE